jgi:hypothetical protein
MFDAHPIHRIARDAINGDGPAIRILGLVGPALRVDVAQIPTSRVGDLQDALELYAASVTGDDGIVVDLRSVV